LVSAPRRRSASRRPGKAIANTALMRGDVLAGNSSITKVLMPLLAH
jgi:hypothetical protein